MKRKLFVFSLALVCVFCCVLSVSAEELHFSDWVSDTQVTDNVATRSYFPETTAYWYVSGRNYHYFSQNRIEYTASSGYPVYVDIYPFGQDNYLRLDAFKSGGTLALTWRYDLAYLGGIDFDLVPIFTYYDKNLDPIRQDTGDTFRLTDDESIRVVEALDIPADAVFFDICFECNSVTSPTYNQVLDFNLRSSSFTWDYQVDAQNAAQVDNILTAMDKLIYGYEYESWGNIFDEVSAAEDFIWENVIDADVMLEDSVLGFFDKLYLFSGAFQFAYSIFEMFMLVEIYDSLLLVSLSLGAFALLLGTVAVFIKRSDT